MNTIAPLTERFRMLKLEKIINLYAQKKWEDIHAEELAIKKKSMAESVTSMRLIGATNLFLWRDARTTYAQSGPIRALSHALKSATAKKIEAEMERFYAANPDSRSSNHCVALQDVPRDLKRTVLRAMPIVSVPISAAFLGVPDKELHNFGRDHNWLLGDAYQGGFCYSIDELFLIAQNPTWLKSIERRSPLASNQLPNDAILDHSIFVSEAVACSFLDMNPYELRRKVTQSTRKRRPYRLSDLEKIRTAMLAEGAK